MNNKLKSTAPKPFIFVLMPFDEKFNDIYKYGIKGAAEKADAYAERVDEQIFTGGILERIFNQINKADVIVADMTGRNENVFYEVGYAHALGKIVLLLTQNADDIPFDLKNKPHIVYDGKIEKLEGDLTKRLIWAIGEASKKGKQNLLERLLVSLPGIEIPESNSSNNVPIIEITKDTDTSTKYDISQLIKGTKITSTFSIRNRSPELINITLVYLFTSGRIGSTEKLDEDFCWNLPIGVDNFDSSDGLSKQFKLSHNITPLPVEAVDQLKVEIGYFHGKTIDELFKLRIHTSSGSFHDFPFRLKAEFN